MNNARNIEPDLRLNAAQLNVEMGDWGSLIGPVVGHFASDVRLGGVV